MRYLLILIVFAASVANAQEENDPEIFPNVMGVKQIKSFDGKDSTGSYTVHKLDGLSHITESRYYCSGKPCGKHIYVYNDNRLSYHQNYVVYGSFEIDSNGIWDSTAIGGEEFYAYNNDALISIKYYRTNHEISVQVNYIYNLNGTLAKEETYTYPQPGIVVAFEPGSTTMSNKPAPSGQGITYKEFSYADNRTIVKWYTGGKRTKTEIIEKSVDGNVTKRIMKGMNGRVLKQESRKYNQKGLLIEILSSDNGYDDHDFVFGDRQTFRYSSNGRMTNKISYSKGKAFMEEHYKYEE